MTKTVDARKLKTRLAHYLRKVRGGRTIVVSERGEPVAELRPIAPAKATTLHLDRLVALGLLSRTSQAPLRPFRPILQKRATLSRAVVEGREDRF